MGPTKLECERCGRSYEGLPSQIEDLCLACLWGEVSLEARSPWPEGYDPVLDEPVPYRLAEPAEPAA